MLGPPLPAAAYAALPEQETERVSPWEIEVDPEEERRRADDARRQRQAAARALRARQNRRWGGVGSVGCCGAGWQGVGWVAVGWGGVSFGGCRVGVRGCVAGWLGLLWVHHPQPLSSPDPIVPLPCPITTDPGLLMGTRPRQHSRTPSWLSWRRGQSVHSRRGGRVGVGSQLAELAARAERAQQV